MTFNLAIALLFTLGATAFLLQSVWHLILALEARSWPTAQGVMLSSKLAEEHDGEDVMYHARVSYRFTANGRELIGDRAYFGGFDRTTWSVFARNIVAKYPPGALVTVHYDPDRPEQAVLEPGVSGALVAILVFEIVFLAIAVWVLRDAIHA